MRVNEKGIALVSLIILITVFGALGVAAVRYLSQSTAGGIVELNRARAFYLAEAGVNDAFWELKYSEKLYGTSGDDYGLIDTRTVSFEGGLTGGYRASEDDNEILSRGMSGGTARELIQRVAVGGVNYSLYRYDSGGDFTIETGTEITGNVFTRSSVIVSTLSALDSSSVSFFLREGESVNYQGGGPFPAEILADEPEPPVLDVSWYDSLITEASSAPGGSPGQGAGGGGAGGPPGGSSERWGSRNLGEVELLNGDLRINTHSDISTVHDSSLVVVNGSVVIMPWAEIGDNIKIIAADGIRVSPNSRVGITEGRSGNLLYAGNGSIEIRDNSEVNGTILANSGCEVRKSEINGLVWADLIDIGNGVEIRGALWTNSITGNDLEEDSKVLDFREYLPAGMPIGLNVTWDVSTLERAENGWREKE